MQRFRLQRLLGNIFLCNEEVLFVINLKKKVKVQAVVRVRVRVRHQSNPVLVHHYTVTAIKKVLFSLLAAALTSPINQLAPP